MARARAVEGRKAAGTFGLHFAERGGGPSGRPCVRKTKVEGFGSSAITAGQVQMQPNAARWVGVASCEQLKPSSKPELPPARNCTLPSHTPH